MGTISIEKTIEQFEKFRKKADLIRGSQSGNRSSWWDGKTKGIKECIDYLKQRDVELDKLISGQMQDMIDDGVIKKHVSFGNGKY